MKKILLIFAIHCFAVADSKNNLPRIEVGLSAYQPSDDFVNGYIRANNSQYLMKLRMGYTITSFFRGDIHSYLDFQPNFKNNIGTQNFIAEQVGSDWIKSNHTSLGLLWNWKFFGFGPEIRSESYRAVTGGGQKLASVRLNRLWWRYSIGYISKPAPIRLIARFEIAGTNQVPSRTSSPDIPSMLKAMAPDHEYGIYAGVKI